MTGPPLPCQDSTRLFHKSLSAAFFCDSLLQETAFQMSHAQKYESCSEIQEGVGFVNIF